MKIVIVGAGLIGQERISAIQSIVKSTNKPLDIVAVCDINAELLSKVKDKYNVPIVNNIKLAMDLKPDWVFICTTNDAALEVAESAFQAGANVLTEKPLGRTLEECNKIIALKPPHLKLQVGFNYRFFDGIEAALHDAKSGKFGKLISVNLVLAHGNAPGMEKSWHLDPIKRGSVVADLGVHLFDLILQLASGRVTVQHAKSWSGFWKTGIIEETHILLSDEAGTIYNTQVSFDRWRSNFRLEINGTEGYGVVEGRGRSFGPQSYKTGVRWGWAIGKNQIDTETLVINKNACTNSFMKETAAILSASDGRLTQACSFEGARDVMTLLEQCAIK